jgi:hypothetical protein
MIKSLRDLEVSQAVAYDKMKDPWGFTCALLANATFLDIGQYNLTPGLQPKKRYIAGFSSLAMVMRYYFLQRECEMFIITCCQVTQYFVHGCRPVHTRLNSNSTLLESFTARCAHPVGLKISSPTV